MISLQAAIQNKLLISGSIENSQVCKGRMLKFNRGNFTAYNKQGLRKSNTLILIVMIDLFENINSILI